MVCKYYCFADIKKGTIIRLSPVDKKRDNDPCSTEIIFIDDELAYNLINSKEKYSNIKIIKRNNRFEAALIPKLIDEFKQFFSTRLESLALQEIIYDDKPGDTLTLNIKYMKKSKKLKFELENSFIIELLKEPIPFYITGKNDPSKLLKVIFISAQNVLFNLNYSLSNISIFTKKVFNNYYLEILNE